MIISGSKKDNSMRIAANETPYDLMDRYADEMAEWLEDHGWDVDVRRSRMSESQYVLASYFDEDEDIDVAYKVRISMHHGKGMFSLDFGHADDDFEVRPDRGEHWTSGVMAMYEDAELDLPGDFASLYARGRKIVQDEVESAVEVYEEEKKEQMIDDTAVVVETMSHFPEYGIMSAYLGNHTAQKVVVRSGGTWKEARGSILEGDDELWYDVITDLDRYDVKETDNTDSREEQADILLAMGIEV